MSYEAWRITFQNAEQAARCAYESSAHWHDQFQQMSRAFDKANKAAEKFGRRVLVLEEEIQALEQENLAFWNRQKMKVVR